jgi:hypothetical protein
MCTEWNTEFYLRVKCLTFLYKGRVLFNIMTIWANERMTRELVLYIFCAITLYTQDYSQLIPQFVLLLLYVSTANYSHLHGATKCGIPIQSATEVVKYKW